MKSYNPSKKLFLLILVLLFLLPGCGTTDAPVTVYCVEKVETSTGTLAFTYDEMGNLLLEPTHDGRIIARSYDESGNLLTWKEGNTYYRYTYDPKGNLLTMEDLSGAYPKTTVYTYDSRGNMLTETYGSTTCTYTYSKKNILIRAVREQDGFRYVNVYNNSGDPLTSEVYGPEESEPRQKTVWAYDAKGRCVSETQYKNNAVNARELYTYDKEGNLLMQQDDPDIPKNSPSSTVYTYDGSGNMLSCKEYYSPNGKEATLNRHTTYRYDQTGRLLETCDLDPADGSIQRQTVWTYGNTGRLLTKTYTAPLFGIESIWTYDENESVISYQWNERNGPQRSEYTYIAFSLSPEQAERVLEQQNALLENLEQTLID